MVRAYGAEGVARGPLPPRAQEGTGMAAMKPRTGVGPLEVTKEGRGIVMRVPLEGGGRLVVELNAEEGGGGRAGRHHGGGGVTGRNRRPSADRPPPGFGAGGVLACALSRVRCPE